MGHETLPHSISLEQVEKEKPSGQANPGSSVNSCYNRVNGAVNTVEENSSVFSLIRIR